MRTPRPARVLVTALLGLLIPAAAAQRLDPGPQVLTFFSDVDDTDQPYALYLPPGFDETRAYPLVVSLHGAGSNHRLNLRRVFGESNAPGETDVEASRYFPPWEDVDYVVAAPYARGTMGYQGIAEKDVLDVLADVKRRFRIDEDRVYLTGLSMGGGGTLWLGLTRPDVWAAIAPVCPAPPSGTEVFAPNALHVPVHLFQGAADTVVPTAGVRAWAERLRALGTAVEYTEYPGVGHNSWEDAYADGQIFDWFAQFRRDPFPERVRFTSDRHAFNRAYWIRLDALTPGTPAHLDAAFTETNRIAIETTDLDGFTITLAGHPRYTPGEEVVVAIDGVRFAVPAEDTLSFRRVAGRWEPGRADPAGLRKRAGAEGPISAVVAGRHLDVYGTGGDPSDETIAARREQAEVAANWSVYRGPFWGRIYVFPRVVADRDVRPSDLESANLVLFGTAETNAVIARYADRLPLRLDPAASDDFGLVYVFPVGGRYVLVNEGLPWWHVAEGTERPWSFGGPVPAFDLLGMPDFRLFRRSAEAVVAEGRFDTRWRVPAEDTAALRATGVVTVREE